MHHKAFITYILDLVLLIKRSIDSRVIGVHALCEHGRERRGHATLTALDFMLDWFIMGFKSADPKTEVETTHFHSHTHTHTL